MINTKDNLVTCNEKYMKKKSIFEELNSFVPTKHKEDIIESRATHVISSAINILDAMYDEFGTDVATVMEKKFLSSIRGRDPARFTKTVQKLKYDGEKEDATDSEH